MLSLVVALVVLAPELPVECQAPPTREVSVLTGFAQSSGSFSVGLDSVATWCFDSGGAWTGGQKPASGKKVASTNPTGDCAKAIISCEAARASMSAETKSVLYDALKDIERPFLGVKYKPKRSGLAERPPEVAECSSRDRSTLFSHAQARMDLARLASQVQNEYANYKTWLFSEGLKCGQAMARGEKDSLRKGVAIDTPTQGGGTQQVPGTAAGGGTVAANSPSPTGLPEQSRGGTVAGVGTLAANPTATTKPTSDPSTALGVTGSGSPTAKTKTGSDPSTALGVTGSGSPAATTKPASDPSTALGVTGSGSPTATPRQGSDPSTPLVVNGTPANPAGGTLVASTTRPTSTGTPTGTPTSPGNPLAATLSPGIPLGGPTAEREKALSSTMLEKWKFFLLEQGKIEGDGDWVAGFLASRELRDCRCVRPVPGEVVRRLENKDRVPQLEADDEKNTRCELCLLDSFPRWKVRAQKQCTLALELTEYELGVLQRSDDGNGFPPRCAEAAKQKPPGTSTPAKPAVAGAQPTAQPKANNAYIITKTPDAIGPMADFLKPNDYAPIPAREDGRVYVRIFTSSACVAEVLPGPVQARTGDLLPVPPSAREITVRGPCGGFAELYFGREEKPRVAESFARNQPLRLQFRP